jgi:hypothetical protein
LIEVKQIESLKWQKAIRDFSATAAAKNAENMVLRTDNLRDIALPW